MLYKELARLIELMNSPQLTSASLISWGSPILSFGNLRSAKLATIGLNPSNREFVNEIGKELDGKYRRFHTLNSLGLHAWREANTNHYDLMLDCCFTYFYRNPYDNWFKKLDYIISGASYSYYLPSGRACHLDLIPYATFTKWTGLSSYEKDVLLRLSSNFLGKLLNHSEITTIILNGQTVVENLEKVTQTKLKKELREEWTLPRKVPPGVIGYSYEGEISNIGSITLKRKIKVLGYNHNIQSSFGVTKKVQESIRRWIANSLI